MKKGCCLFSCVKRERFGYVELMIFVCLQICEHFVRDSRGERDEENKYVVCCLNAVLFGM